jgi:hypothetical protein
MCLTMTAMIGAPISTKRLIFRSPCSHFYPNNERGELAKNGVYGINDIHRFLIGTTMNTESTPNNTPAATEAPVTTATTAVVAPKPRKTKAVAKPAEAVVAPVIAETEVVDAQETNLAVDATPAKAKTSKTPKSAKATKAAKPSKPVKVKLVRDSFTMPSNEYEQIAALKARCLNLGQSVKKSELLRAGLAALVALDDLSLKTAVAAVETLKTGRPAKT